MYAFTNLLTINDNAFRNNAAMSGVLKIPAATNIGQAAFFGCETIYEVQADSLIAVGNQGFQLCNNLIIFTCPVLEILGAYVFASDINLDTLEFPVLSNPDSSAFSGWAGVGKSLAVPSALTTDPAIIAADGDGATIIFI